MRFLKRNEISSPYDLKETLWYIIPGATLMLLIILFEYWFVVQIKGVVGYNNLDRVESIYVYNNIDTISLKDSILRHSNDYYYLSIDTNQSNAIISAKLDSITFIRDSIFFQQDSLARALINKEFVNNIHTPIFTALSFTLLKERDFLKDNWVIAAMFLLILLSICYVLGHISYMIGSFLFERILVSKGYSYPYLKLLKLKEHETKNSIEIEASQGFYRGLIFWITTIYLLIFLFSYLKEYSEFIRDYRIYAIFFLILLFVIIPFRLKVVLRNITKWDHINKEETRKKIRLHTTIRPKIGGLKSFLFCSLTVFIISLFWNPLLCLFFGIIFSMILLEFIIRIRVMRDEKTPCSINYLKKNFEIDPDELSTAIEISSGNSKSDQAPYYQIKIIIEAIFICWYNFLGNEVDKFCNNYFRTQTNFDSPFILEHKKSFKKVFKCYPNKLTRHNYWFSKYFVMENSLYLNQQINFWENVSRFTKCLSASLLMAYIYCSISFMSQYPEVYKVLVGDSYSIQVSETYQYSILILFLIPLIYFVITGLAIRYYIYVYDNRYTRLILRGFVTLVSSCEYHENLKETNRQISIQKPELK